MKRAEHLTWAKERALDLVDRGEWVMAAASMIFDLSKHPETANNAGILGAFHLGGPDQTREWIQSFN